MDDPNRNSGCLNRVGSVVPVLAKSARRMVGFLLPATCVVGLLWCRFWPRPDSSLLDRRALEYDAALERSVPNAAERLDTARLVAQALLALSDDEWRSVVDWRRADPQPDFDVDLLTSALDAARDAGREELAGARCTPGMYRALAPVAEVWRQPFEQDAAIQGKLQELTQEQWTNWLGTRLESIGVGPAKVEHDARLSLDPVLAKASALLVAALVANPGE